MSAKTSATALAAFSAKRNVDTEYANTYMRLRQARVKGEQAQVVSSLYQDKASNLCHFLRHSGTI